MLLVSVHLCVCVCVRECDQVSGSGLFMSFVWIRNTPTQAFKQPVHFIVDKSSPATLATPFWELWDPVKNSNIRLYCTLLGKANIPFPHALSKIRLNLWNTGWTSPSLTLFFPMSGSSAFRNGRHPGCLQTAACWQGTAGMYSEQSQVKQCLKRLLADVLWPAQALHLLRFWWFIVAKFLVFNKYTKMALTV